MAEKQVSPKSVFDRAVEIESAAQREVFLDEACAGRPQLRADVDSLLRAYGDAGSFLEAGAPVLSPTADLPAITERAGAVIGPYKLLQQIGEGGFGVVYMAEQCRPIRRKVALKIIKPGMDTKEVIGRFEAERQALALMDHPNIARVFDGGATDTGRPYFVMELVKGVPITQFCDENRLSPRDRLELFATICKAIQHAHQKGVIHRDIKPTNVMVTLHDGQPVVKVIDFGVAKAITQELTARTLFTAYGQMIGTPQYMSPEQAEMSGLDVDTRSDIYSLGVLLYELLTSTTPLDSHLLRGKAYAELQRMIREEEGVRPSVRLSTLGELTASIAAQRGTDPKKLRAVVRGELDWIVMKSLEKSRDRRYATANDFAADVERYLNHEAVHACPPSFLYKSRKFALRNKAVLTTGATIALILITATFVSTWQAVRAMQAEETANTESAVARAVYEFLQEDLLAQADVHNEPDRDIKLRTVLDRAAEKIEKRFADQPRVEGALRLAIGNTYKSLGEYQAARLHLTRCLQLFRQHLGDEHENTLSVMSDLAGVLVNLQKPEEAEPLYLESLEAAKRVLGEDHRETTRLMNNLGWFYSKRGRYSEAESLLVRANAIQQRTLGKDGFYTLFSAQQLAKLYFYWGKFDEAEVRLVDVLAEARRTLHEGHLFTLDTTQMLAEIYAVRGKTAEAETLLVDNFNVCKRVLGREHAMTLEVTSTLGNIYMLQGRNEEAASLLIPSLELSRRVLGEEDATVMRLMGQVAELYQSQGRYSEAESMLLDVADAARRRSGDEHANTLLALSALADQYQMTGKYQQARELLVDVLEKYRRVHHEEHHDALNAARILACVLRVEGDTQAAETLLTKTVDSMRRVLGKDHPLTMFSLRQLAEVHNETERYREAIRLHAELAEANPVDAEICNEVAILLIWAGDNKAHARLCARLLDVAEESNDPQMLLRTAASVLLHPSALPDQTAAAAQIGQRLSAADAGNPWNVLCAGVAAYRGGQHVAAEDWFVRSTTTDDANLLSLAHAFRSMNAFCLDDVKLARRQLRAAERALGLVAAVELNSPFSVEPEALAAWLAINEARTVLESPLLSLQDRQVLVIDIQRQVTDSMPADTHPRLHLAVLRYWFGHEQEHSAQCRELLAASLLGDNAYDCERAAKAYLIRSDAADDADLLGLAVTAADKSMEFGIAESGLPWFQMCSGLAAYRDGDDAKAEQMLTAAQAADNPLIKGPSLLYRAMSRRRQARLSEARADFSMAADSMPPPPDRSKVTEAIIDHDQMIYWLAYAEAKQLLDSPTASHAIDEPGE